MPALEQHNATDCIQTPPSLPSALTDAHQDAWGPRAYTQLQRQPSTSTDANRGLVVPPLTAANDWLRDWCAKPFNHLDTPAGLTNAQKELAKTADPILGIEIGTVKAVYGIGNSIIDTANAVVSPPARLGNFLSNAIKDPQTASSDAAHFQHDVSKPFQAARNYIEQITAKGDYTKPAADAARTMHSAVENFQKLNPGQKTDVVTEQVVGIGAQVATGKILSSAPQAFAALMEKMDAFEVKSNATRLHFGLEPKLQSVEATGLGATPIRQSERQINDYMHKMSDAFRRDADPYSQFHPKGWRKSHLDKNGDLVPANPEGMYKGQEVTISDHLDGGWNAAKKGNSPYTSFSGNDDTVILKYGESKITLNLKGLKEAIASGEVKGVKVFELPEILEAIDASSASTPAKNKHRAWAKRDNEVLVKGTIPAKFLTVEN